MTLRFYTSSNSQSDHVGKMDSRQTQVGLRPHKKKNNSGEMSLLSHIIAFLGIVMR